MKAFISSQRKHRIMKSAKPFFIGVDVSKDELVIAFLNKDSKWNKCKIANTIKDITQWFEQSGIEGKHFILEATGSYSERLIYALNELGALFSVVNPSQSRAMAKVLLKTHKNDEQDAQTLSILGGMLDLNPYQMPDPQHKKRKEAYSALASLQKQAQQLKNQLHAFEYRVNPNPIAVEALENVLKTVEGSIATLEKELAMEVDEEEKIQIIDRISSIKSVGEKTALAIVASLGSLKQFTNAKAFVKFIGLCPTEFTSGTSVKGRSRITKKGSSTIRALLFNCARNAIRFNEPCKALYQRLIAKGKNGKIALTAVMHKIARLIFGVVHSGKKFDPNFALSKTKSC
jgi:transposase